MGLLDKFLVVLFLRAALLQENVDENFKPVGFDGGLGFLCGGDLLARKTVSRISKEQFSKAGYYDLVSIPAGATNIRIGELKESRNYLALRNSTGQLYLYGDWRNDFQHNLTMFGTIFNHQRVYKSVDPNPGPLPPPSKDSIHASGPLTERLYVVVLYHEENSGIEIEYSVKKEKGMKVSIGPVPYYGGRIVRNSTIQVHCNVTSDFQCSGQWLKNNQLLEQTSRIKVLPDNTLLIEQAQLDDSGNYTCQASNGFNEDEDSVQLTIEESIDGEWCEWRYTNTAGICTFPPEFNPEFWNKYHWKTGVRFCECPPPSDNGAPCAGHNVVDYYETNVYDYLVDDELFLAGVTCNFKNDTEEKIISISNRVNCGDFIRNKRDVAHISQKIKTSLDRIQKKKVNISLFYETKPTKTKSVLEEVFNEEVNAGNSRNMTKEHLLTLHHMITKDDAGAMPGVFRNISVKSRPGGMETYFPPASKVEELMEEYLQFLNSKEDTTNPVLKAAMACFKLLNIHPFKDGNGRMGRLLMNILLVRAGFPPVDLPRMYRAEFGDALAEHMIGRDPTEYTTPGREDMMAFLMFITRRLEETMDKWEGPGGLKFSGYTDMHI